MVLVRLLEVLPKDIHILDEFDLSLPFASMLLTLCFPHVVCYFTLGLCQLPMLVVLYLGTVFV